MLAFKNHNSNGSVMFKNPNANEMVHSIMFVSYTDESMILTVDFRDEDAYLKTKNAIGPRVIYKDMRRSVVDNRYQIMLATRDIRLMNFLINQLIVLSPALSAVKSALKRDLAYQSIDQIQKWIEHTVTRIHTKITHSLELQNTSPEAKIREIALKNTHQEVDFGISLHGVDGQSLKQLGEELKEAKMTSTFFVDGANCLHVVLGGFEKESLMNFKKFIWIVQDYDSSVDDLVVDRMRDHIDQVIQKTNAHRSMFHRECVGPQWRENNKNQMELLFENTSPNSRIKSINLKKDCPRLEFNIIVNFKSDDDRRSFCKLNVDVIAQHARVRLVIDQNEFPCKSRLKNFLDAVMKFDQSFDDLTYRRIAEVINSYSVDGSLLIELPGFVENLSSEFMLKRDESVIFSSIYPKRQIGQMPSIDRSIQNNESKTLTCHVFK